MIIMTLVSFPDSFSNIWFDDQSSTVKHASKFYSVDTSGEAEDFGRVLEKPTRKRAIDSVDEDPEAEGSRMRLRPRKS